MPIFAKTYKGVHHGDKNFDRKIFSHYSGFAHETPKNLAQILANFLKIF